MADMPDTQDSLIAQLQDASNAAAWESFALIYRPVVYRLARARGLQHADADDLSSISQMDIEQTAIPPQITQVLEALHPTDGPAMLGRLGGYEISGAIGAGGMDVVLKGLDRALDRTVAIKVMAPHLATSGAARQRFSREARAAAAVIHPNVIAIHSVCTDATLPYLVMPIPCVPVAFPFARIRRWPCCAALPTAKLDRLLRSILPYRPG